MATVTCPGCLERDAESADLKRRVAELRALVREHIVRHNTHATHSGVPPSPNLPDAPPLPPEKFSGRKPEVKPTNTPADLLLRRWVL